MIINLNTLSIFDLLQLNLKNVFLNIKNIFSKAPGYTSSLLHQSYTLGHRGFAILYYSRNEDTGSASCDNVSLKALNFLKIVRQNS